MCVGLFLAVCRVAKALLVLGGISANATATGVARRHARIITMMCQQQQISLALSHQKEKERTNKYRRHPVSRHQDVKLLCKPTH
jgi:hypothetical protein